MEDAAAGRAGAQDLAADRAAEAAVSFEAADKTLGNVFGLVGEGVVDLGDGLKIGEGEEDVAVGGVCAKGSVGARLR